MSYTHMKNQIETLMLKWKIHQGSSKEDGSWQKKELVNLKDRSIASIQSQEHKEKRKKKNGQNLKDLCGTALSVPTYA